MKHMLLLLIVILALQITPISAQDGPIPDVAYSPITPDNVERLQQLTQLQSFPATDLAWSSNHTAFAITHTSSAVSLYRTFETVPATVYNTHAANNMATAVTFDVDNRHIASASADSTVHIMSINRGELTAILPHDSWVWSVAFHPNDDLIATGDQDGNIQMWETDDNEPLSSFTAQHDAAVTGLFIDVDNNRLISASLDGTARIWELSTGEPLMILEGHEQGIATLAVNMEVGLIATASGDGSIRLWDADTGDELYVLEDHAGGVSAVSFNADGTLLASAGQDTIVRFWDTTSGELISSLEGQGSWIQGLAFNQIGTLLASCNLAGVVYVWGIPERS